MSEPVDMSAEALSREVHHLRREVSELSQNVRDLVEAWNTARGVVRFVKTLGSIATAGAALWALFTLIWERK